MHWFLHFFGLDSPSGPAYLAWSGSLSDLGELTLIGGLVAIYRKHTCEVAHCWRLARHTTAANHAVCRRHHPEGAPTYTDVAKAHETATQMQTSTSEQQNR